MGSSLALAQDRAYAVTKILGVVVLAVVVIGSVASLVSPSGGTPAPGDDSATLGVRACMEAVDAVTSELKAPSTANFPSCGWSLDQYEIREDATKKTVWVFGHVDAQNSFGAMLRSKFGVQLARSGGDWKVRKVTIE